jgi:hypothetical protein
MRTARPRVRPAAAKVLAIHRRDPTIQPRVRSRPGSLTINLVQKSPKPQRSPRPRAAYGAISFDGGGFRRIANRCWPRISEAASPTAPVAAYALHHP